MFYRNVSKSTKTFYGVVFKAGETKEVAGPINDMLMIRVEQPIAKAAKSQKSPSISTKEEKKVEDKKQPAPKVESSDSEDSSN